jgi:hypothetical protein
MHLAEVAGHRSAVVVALLLTLPELDQLPPCIDSRLIYSSMFAGACRQNTMMVCMCYSLGSIQCGLQDTIGSCW